MLVGSAVGACLAVAKSMFSLCSGHDFLYAG